MKKNTFKNNLTDHFKIRLNFFFYKMLIGNKVNVENKS